MSGMTKRSGTSRLEAAGTDSPPAPPGAATPPADRLRPLDQDTGWLMARTSHALGSALTRAVGSVGLNLREHTVLLAAVTGPPRSQLALAHAVGLDKSTMVALLDELVARGLATRQPSPTDRRVRLVQPTDAGRAAIAASARAAAEAEHTALADLTAAEHEQLTTLLRRLVHGRLCTTLEPGSCL